MMQIHVKEYKELFENMIINLQKKIELFAFILFGSRARGDSTKYSDYDVVIIGSFKEPFMDRGEWVVQLTPDVAIDIFCYTPKEFATMFHSYRLTAIDAIGEGIPLYGEVYLAPYRKLYKEFIKNGMRKETCVLYPPKYDYD